MIQNEMEFRLARYRRQILTATLDNPQQRATLQMLEVKALEVMVEDIDRECNTYKTAVRVGWLKP